jgi:3-oxoacyl-[acyl-carrier-protein] synthase-3
MLNIVDVAVAFPAREERIEQTAAELALTPTALKMFQRYYGFERFRINNEESLFALLNRAMASLSARHPMIKDELRILAHCHTTSDIATFGNDARHWLPDCVVPNTTETMSLTMNHCATGLSMLTFMDAILPPDGLGVLLVGEKAFHRTIRLIQNTSIMGEAAAAVLVGHCPGILQCLGVHTTHEGEFSVISGNPDSGSMVGFGPLYYDFMVSHIRGVLSRHALRIDDLRYIFPHNVNTASWRRIANSLAIPLDKIYLQNIARYGHCFGTDPFISVSNALELGLLAAGDRVLLISAGLGGTVSTALISVSQTTPGFEEELSCTPKTLQSAI